MYLGIFKRIFLYFQVNHPKVIPFHSVFYGLVVGYGFVFFFFNCKAILSCTTKAITDPKCNLLSGCFVVVVLFLP